MGEIERGETDLGLVRLGFELEIGFESLLG